MLGFLNPEESLLAGFENHQNDFIADLPDKLNEDTRWLAASALQKCIRLGLTQEALHAAHVLKTFSDTHLWYRLSVICLEDIGVANVDLAAQVLWMSGKTQWRNSHRGDNFILSYLIPRLCASRKCRTLDDALYVAEYHPVYKDQRLIYSGMAVDELWELFHDERLDVVGRILISRYLCGTRYRSEVLELQKRNPSIIFDLAHSMGAPPYVTDLLSLSRGQEYFTCLLPAMMQLEQSSFCDAVSDASDPVLMFGEWPNAAYDRHTRMGKQAFRQFLKKCPDISGFLQKRVPEADHVNLIGWAVFILEGQLLNNRIVYDGSECLRELAAQAWLYSGGMGIEMQDEFLNLVSIHFKGINDSRGFIRDSMAAFAHGCKG